MTVHTGARFGLSWGFQAGDSGWGASFNLQASLLEAMLALVLQSDSITSPPDSPDEDDAYFIPLAATGEWSGNSGKIAAYQGGAWQFYAIPMFMRARIVDRTGFFYFNGSAWVAEVTSGSGGVASVAGRTGTITLSVGDVAGAAPLSSPNFTGSPTTANQAALSRNTLIANTKYVDDAVGAATGGAKVTSVAGRTGAITLSHNDLTDWSTALSAYGFASTAYVDMAVSSIGSIPQSWATLPAAAQQLPLAFIIPGKPTASQTYNLVLVAAATIPANFVGTKSYQGTQATANMVWAVNKISGGVTSAVGTLTLGAASKTALTLSVQAAINFTAGDVLQLVAPSAQDTTGADIGITILAAKV